VEGGWTGPDGDESPMIFGPLPLGVLHAESGQGLVTSRHLGQFFDLGCGGQSAAGSMPCTRIGFTLRGWHKRRSVSRRRADDKELVRVFGQDKEPGILLLRSNDIDAARCLNPSCIRQQRSPSRKCR